MYRCLYNYIIHTYIYIYIYISFTVLCIISENEIYINSVSRNLIFIPLKLVKSLKFG